MKITLAILSILVCSLSVKAADQVVFTEQAWHELKYSSIPANINIFKNNTLTIQVNKSASPLIYPLKEGINIKEIRVSGSINGKLNLDPKKKQGLGKQDDFLFRLGLVVEGNQTLNFFQRKVAADWVLKLFELGKNAKGIEGVSFYNIYSDPKLEGRKRRHPASGLLKEHFVQMRPKENEFTMVIPFDPKKRVLALWLSSDGDDTASRFKVRLDQISYDLVKSN